MHMSLAILPNSHLPLEDHFPKAYDSSTAPRQVARRDSVLWIDRRPIGQTRRVISHPPYMDRTQILWLHLQKETNVSSVSTLACFRK